MYNATKYKRCSDNLKYELALFNDLADKECHEDTIRILIANKEDRMDLQRI